MHAVILAGGRGTRMGTLTKNQPKSLLSLNGKALICHALDALPSKIESIIIVTGFLGEQIIAHIGNNYRGRPVQYITQRLTGTGGALLAVREKLSDRFMVLNSDDLYSKGELTALLQYEAVYGISKIPPHLSKSETVVFNENNVFVGRQPLSQESEGWMGAGVYIFHEGMWGTTFTQLKNGEYSIPHTLAKLPFLVYVHKLHHWFPINTQKELALAETKLKE